MARCFITLNLLIYYNSKLIKNIKTNKEFLKSTAGVIDAICSRWAGRGRGPSRTRILNALSLRLWGHSRPPPLPGSHQPLRPVPSPVPLHTPTLGSSTDKMDPPPAGAAWGTDLGSWRRTSSPPARPCTGRAASPWRRGRAALRARLPELSGPSHPFPARRWGSVRPGKHRDCERSARCFAGAQVGSERAALNGSVPQRWENFWSWLEAVLNGHLQWAGFLLSQNRGIVRVGRHRSGSNAP